MMSQETGCWLVIVFVIMMVVIIAFGMNSDNHDARIAELEKAMAIYMEPK